MPWNKLPTLNPADYTLLFGAEYTGNGMIGTNLLEHNLDTYIAALPTVAERTAERGPARTTERWQPWQRDLLVRYPWLEGAWEEEKRRKAAPAGGGGVAQQDPQLIEDDELSPEEWLEVLRQFNEAKEAYSLDGDDFAHWSVKPLGGKWTRVHKGKAFDAFRGAPARGSPAMAWATQYRMQQAARFDIGPYTVAGAWTLAKTYCAKCEHFLPCTRPGVKRTSGTHQKTMRLGISQTSS